MKDELLSVVEAAALLGLSVPHTRQLCADGELTAKQVGRAYVIRRRDVEALRKRRLREAVPAEGRGRGRPVKAPPAPAKAAQDEPENPEDAA